MFEIFGSTLGVIEVLSIAGVMIALIGGWFKLDNKLNNILERNAKADQAHIDLTSRVNGVERILRQEITEHQVAVDAKISAQDERLRVQDIYSGRIEEKFNFMQGQITRILNILEKDR